MKRKTTIILVALPVMIMAIIVSPAFDQRMPLRRSFEKGTFIGSGGFTFSSSGGELYNEDGKRLTQFNFNPSISYFVTSGLAVGLKGSISFSSLGDQSYSALGIGPEVSYYLRKGKKSTDSVMVKGSLIPYFSAGVMFVRTSGTYPSQWGDYNYKATGTTFDLGGGLLYMLSQGYGIFVRASYEFQRTSSTSGDPKNGNRLVISGGLSAFAF
jgi:hypothetical protein